MQHRVWVVGRWGRYVGVAAVVALVAPAATMNVRAVMPPLRSCTEVATPVDVAELVQVVAAHESSTANEMNVLPLTVTTVLAGTDTE